MPGYLRDHCVYYAGPAKTLAGMASGSFGPTTAGRMDFPAFVVVDDKGNDFFDEVSRPVAVRAR